MRQCHPEDYPNLKIEVEVQNTCDEVWDSQPSLRKNQKERCREDVMVEQMCVDDLPHCSVMVELFDEGTMDNHL